MCDVPPRWKIEVWVAAWGLALVDELQGEKISQETATEDSSYLLLVIGSIHFHPPRTLLLHGPRRAWHELYAGLIPVKDQVCWNLLHCYSREYFFEECSLRLCEISNSVFAFCGGGLR